MGIAPVQINLYVPEDQASQNKPQPQPPAEGSSSEPGPKREADLKVKDAATSDIPQEEVKVHRDNSTGEPVYQFVDNRSGSLILQMPSEQMLNFAQDVDQELASMTAKDTAAAEERGSHGNLT